MYIRQDLKFTGGSMMVNSFTLWLSMNLPARLIALRKERGLSQQAMADAIGIHVNSLKKYETGQAQPSIDALRKIATTLHTSTDYLLFDEHERGPSDDLRLQFEAVSQFPEEERKIIKALLEGMIIKHQTKRWVDNLSS
jgi:transcriptional regulator with XRE-family HTH domain